MGSALDRAAERWGQACVLDGGEETALGGSPLVEAESWGCGATRVPGAAPRRSRTRTELIDGFEAQPSVVTFDLPGTTASGWYPIPDGPA